MHTNRIIRLGVGWAGCLAIAMVAACSDTVPTAPSNASQFRANPFVASLTSADVVVPGTGADAGAFTNTIVPFGNVGRATGAFWDNPSVDGPTCNIGFYATGTLSAVACDFEVAGSDANQGGGYTKYWGDNGTAGTSAGRDPSSFMFKGANIYTVKLLGSYALFNSEVGWFTKSGGVYTFHPIADWGNKVINSTVTIYTGGQDWGLYIHNLSDPLPGGCSDPATMHDCSDATGGFTTMPAQQFALMGNPADPTKYLVGAEDNHQEILSETGFDADYQDFIWSVVAAPAPVLFVIGDVEAHGIGDNVNFWGAQWWKNNVMSGLVSNGVAAFKGYATEATGGCGGTWLSLPGNSSNPPDVIPEYVAVIVTSTVLKSGNDISGNIQQIVLVHQDGGYGPNPGHAGNGPVTSVVCPLTNGD